MARRAACGASTWATAPRIGLRREAACALPPADRNGARVPPPGQCRRSSSSPSPPASASAAKAGEASPFAQRLAEAAAQRQAARAAAEAAAEAAEAAEEAEPAALGDAEGEVVDVVGGMAVVRGLRRARPWSLVRFDDGEQLGVAVDLRRDGSATVALLGGASDGGYGYGDGALSRGSGAVATGDDPSFWAGRGTCGRVWDPLGRPLEVEGVDGDTEAALAAVQAAQRIPVLRHGTPPVAARGRTLTQLSTGWKALDAFYPLGRGRSLAVTGAPGTAKSRVALRALARQAESGAHLVYVAVGQSRQALRRVVQGLRDAGVLHQTTVVAAPGTASAALQYLAPFAAMAAAEHTRDGGGHAVVVFDELGAHADAAARLSPVGSAQTKHGVLLGSCAQLAPSAGGGSLTALALVDSTPPAGDIAVAARTKLVERIASYADDAVRLTSGELLDGERSSGVGGFLPVAAGSLGSRAAQPFQLPALHAYVNRVKQLLLDLDSSVGAARKALAVGIDPEADLDATLDFHAKVSLLLVPDAAAVELAADAGALTREQQSRRAAMLGQRTADARSGGPGSPHEDSAAGSAGGHAGAGDARDSVMPLNREALLAMREERLLALKARAGRRERAIGAAHTAGDATGDGPDAAPRAVSEASMGQLIASLFAIAHGYVACVPLHHVVRFERGMWDALSSIPAPTGTESLLAALEGAPVPAFAHSAVGVADVVATERALHRALLAQSRGREPGALCADAELPGVHPTWRAMHAVVGEYTRAFVARVGEESD